MLLDKGDAMIAIPTDSAYQAVGSRSNNFDSDNNFEYERCRILQSGRIVWFFRALNALQLLIDLLPNDIERNTEWGIWNQINTQSTRFFLTTNGLQFLVDFLANNYVAELVCNQAIYHITTIYLLRKMMRPCSSANAGLRSLFRIKS